MTDRRPPGVAATRAAAVEVFDDSGFLGSGFVLSPTMVLTAAHVARRGRAGLGVRGACGRAGAARPGRLFPTEPGDGRFHAFPDLALLDLDRTVAAVPLLLDAGRPPEAGTAVLVSGFSTHTPVPGVHCDSLLLTVAGPAAGYLRLTGDEVRDGFSGGMVVRLDSGAVCGVLKGSRDFDGVRGGWFTPLSALAAALPVIDPLRHALTAGAEAAQQAGSTAGAGPTASASAAEHANPAEHATRAPHASSARPAGPARPARVAGSAVSSGRAVPSGRGVPPGHAALAEQATPAERATPAHRAGAIPGARELVPLLLAVPDLDDPDFRRQVLRAAGEQLGPSEPLRVAHRSQAVDHLMELVQACASHRDPATALAAVLDALDFLRPGLAAVDELRTLADLPQAGSGGPAGDGFPGPRAAGPGGCPW